MRIQTKKTENISEQSSPEFLMNYDICKGIPSVKTMSFIPIQSQKLKKERKKKYKGCKPETKKQHPVWVYTKQSTSQN